VGWRRVHRGCGYARHLRRWREPRPVCRLDRQAGSVTVECLGSANISTSEYGLRKQLVISGGGVNLTSQAVYEGFQMTPEVNGVTRYTVTFNLLDG